jgi:hypothetical protein
LKNYCSNSLSQEKLKNSRFVLFASFAVKIALNNVKLSRILTPYLPANYPFHANRKFPNRGGAEPSPKYA